MLSQAASCSAWWLLAAVFSEVSASVWFCHFGIACDQIWHPYACPWRGPSPEPFGLLFGAARVLYIWNLLDNHCRMHLIEVEGLKHLERERERPEACFSGVNLNKPGSSLRSFGSFHPLVRQFMLQGCSAILWLCARCFALGKWELQWTCLISLIPKCIWGLGKQRQLCLGIGGGFVSEPSMNTRIWACSHHYAWCSICR